MAEDAVEKRPNANRHASVVYKQNFVRMENSMPLFVSALRRVDAWKKTKAQFAKQLYEARGEANVGFLKDPIVKSAKSEDLIAYVEANKLDFQFMKQLPSVGREIERWWEEVAGTDEYMTQKTVRQMYSDLASIFVESSSEQRRKTFVNQIMRGDAFVWDEEVDQYMNPTQFNEIIFTMAILMTDTMHLGEHLSFLSRTLERFKKFRAATDTKAKRKRRQQDKSMVPRSAVVEIPSVIEDSTIHEEKPPPEEESDVPGTSLIPETTGYLSCDAVRSHMSAPDPLLNDLMFQNTWGGSKNVDKEVSTAERICFPPMHIHGINYSKSKPAPSMSRRATTTLQKSRSEVLRSFPEMQLASILRSTKNQVMMNDRASNQSEMLQRNMSRPGVLNRIHTAEHKHRQRTNIL